jgi:hypothetical protein
VGPGDVELGSAVGVPDVGWDDGGSGDGGWGHDGRGDLGSGRGRAAGAAIVKASGTVGSGVLPPLNPSAENARNDAAATRAGRVWVRRFTGHLGRAGDRGQPRLRW